MSKKAKWRTMVAIMCIATVATVFALPCVSSSAAEEKAPVKIGLITWMEGPALTSGRAHVRAFKSAIKYINDRGGILGGRKIEGVMGPQGETSETAKSTALRLVLRDKVKVLVGPHWAMAVPAGLSVAKRYNLPYVMLQGGTWLYEQKYHALACFAGNAYGRASAQTKWAEEKGYKRVVMVYADIPYNHDVGDRAKEKWERPGSPVEIVDFIWHTFGQTDLKKELTRAVGHNPDLIWFEDWSTDTAVAAIKILHDLDYKGDFVITPVITKSAVQAMPQELTEGVYVFKEWAPDPDVPENKAFCDLFEKEWGELPDYDEEVIWSETVFICLGMDKAGTAGDESKEELMKIGDAMHTLHWVGPYGVPVQLSEGGLALWDRLAFAQIKDKEFVLDTYIPMSRSEWLPWLED